MHQFNKLKFQLTVNINTDKAIKYGEQIVRLSSNHFLTENGKLWDKIYSRGFVLKQVSKKT